jgi:predicted nucleotidyltransferase
MRLSDKSIEIIKQTLKTSFGDKAEIFLFGSRIDDAKRGGDIDLYLIPNSDDDRTQLFDKKMKFLSELALSMEEQKIDLIIARDKQRDIEQEALKNGVRL